MASATVYLNEFPDVTHRVAIGRLRRRRPAALAEITDGRNVAQVDPGEPIEQVITAPDVHEGLARLSPEHRAVITVMYLNQHTDVETAEILGISVRTVRFRSYYALRALHRAVAGSSPGAPDART
jgi:RNA polymerase sigma-70 factor (ECF subfamily)